jgi:DNA-binding transcriptional ArsR family regulator
MGFIKSALLPFLQRLLMSPAGAAMILAALTYMGLRNLAKDFIKGKKAQDRLRELRQLQKNGELTPELETEMKALENAGVTTSMREGQLNAIKETLDLVTVRGYLDDPTRTDDEIQKDLGVSREVLEAYREALDNRELYRKNNIPLPNLRQVAQSFDESVDRTRPIPLRTSEDQSNQVIPVSEPNTVLNETEIDVTGAPNLIPSPVSQQDNSGSRIVSGTLDLDMLAEESGNYTNIQSVNLPSTTSSSSGGGATHQSIPSVINPVLPTFTGMAGGWT